MKINKIKYIIFLTFFTTQMSYAASGQLFLITQLNTGPVLQITTTMPHQYPVAGIKINTPGYTIRSGCSAVDNGYCVFSVNDKTATQISVSSVNLQSANINLTLCLNGLGPVSCQNYDILLNPLNYSAYYAGTYCGNYEYIDISSTGTFIGRGDEISPAVNLASGHPINLYGIVYTSLYMNSNGYISTNNSINTFANFALPTTSTTIPGNSLFAYWDDLDSTGTSPLGLYYQYFDICPRVSTALPGEGCHVFQWITKYYNLPSIAAFTFEALVYDQSGEVSYQYAPGNAQAGSGATTGAQNTSRSSYVQLTYNTAGSVPPSSVRCLKHYQDNT